MHDTSDIEQTIKSYILKEFLPGEDATLLTSTTSVVSSGVLDSIATLRLVGFLEHEFHIEFEAHDIDPEHFDTIARIARLVVSKQGGAHA
ncbi:MAG: acyl carrier protein [Lentisphaerae bacterium]|nr:acyl carrier protein [Lentisphaerota bacterium]